VSTVRILPEAEAGSQLHMDSVLVDYPALPRCRVVLTVAKTELERFKRVSRTHILKCC